MMTIDLHTAYTLTVILASTSVLLASVELLAIRTEFEDGRLFGWDVLRTISRPTLMLGTGRYGQLLSHRLFVPGVAGARAIAALLLIVFTNVPLLGIVCVFTVIITTIALYWRSPLGLDGSDQMSLITFIAIGIHKIFQHDIHVAEASIWFIALQGCLSYFVAGIAKVISPVWRNGEAIRRILSTRTYGSSALAYTLSNRHGVCMALSWLVIGFECFFPLALILGNTWFIVFVVAGILFHVSNAIVMGLNTFVWAFAASYPAILFCAISLQR